jgi:hypothetical protein
MIKSFALIRYWGRNEAVHQLFIDFKGTHDSVRREVLHKHSIYATGVFQKRK